MEISKFEGRVQIFRICEPGLQRELERRRELQRRKDERRRDELYRPDDNENEDVRSEGVALSEQGEPLALVLVAWPHHFSFEARQPLPTTLRFETIAWPEWRELVKIAWCLNQNQVFHVKMPW